MGSYWIDFSGFVCIDAESVEEAREKFFSTYQAPCRDGYDYSYEIDSIEDVSEGG